jgi:hypothetical protein
MLVPKPPSGFSSSLPSRSATKTPGSRTIMPLASFWPDASAPAFATWKISIRSLHRAAPGLRADGQTAYGRDPNVLQLSHGERRTRYESCSGGQDRAFFAQGRQNAGVRPGRSPDGIGLDRYQQRRRSPETRRFLPPLPILAAGSAPP